jgi:tetratricopeptide (TPR) repeat protein
LYLYAVECLHTLLREEGERVLATFFSVVQNPEYRYEIYSKMYDFHIHFASPDRAIDALSRAISEDPARAEAYYKLGKYLCDLKDQPDASIPLLTLASMMRMPKYGCPETEAYTYGPWEALCRANFRIGKYDLAKVLAIKALEHKTPRSDWILQLINYDITEFPVQPMPPEWQEWTEGNLSAGVARCQIMRILEENHFGPGNIITALRLFAAKAQTR